MDKIASLLGIQKQSRDAKTIEDIGFVIANKTHDLVPYKQAIFWIYNGFQVELKTVSGSIKIDESGPYALWLKKNIRDNKKSQNVIQKITSEKNMDWEAKGQYLLTFKSDDGEIFGGIWIETDNEYSPDQLSLLQEIAECYTQSVENIALRQRGTRYFSLSNWSRLKKWGCVLMIVALLFPVRLSITAPAEIVPSHAVSVSMPFDGVIDHVHIQPGDLVTMGQKLVEMDKTQLQTDYDRAHQNVIAAQSSLSRTGFESLRSDEKKSDLQKLRSEIEVLKIEKKYAQKLLGKTTVSAPVEGVAVFSDASALKGRAMATGEKIMMIADPKDAELLIRVPAKSLLPIHVGDDVVFFLNQSPLKDYDANITAIGYEASMDVDGLLTYKIRAKYNNKMALRIGWQGTAKIKSKWSVWGYSLLRKPLIALRNLVGL